MIYVITTLLALSTLWFVITNTRVLFYTTMALIISTSIYLYAKQNVDITIIMVLALSYFSLTFRPGTDGKTKNDYIQLLKHLPLVLIIGIYFIQSRYIRSETTIAADKAEIMPVVIVSMISILICFIGINLSIKKTKGNREYD